MKVKLVLLLTWALGVGMVSQAQNQPRVDKQSEKRERINALVKLEEENDPAFKKQNVFGIKLNTDGNGLSYEIGTYKSPKLTNVFQIELNEKYHPKEEKVSGNIDNFGNISQIKYAKANNFFQLKLGYGQQRLIGGKANKNGVAVSYIYAGGISAGLVKPYYVDVTDVNLNRDFRYKFEDSIPSGSSYNINGASGITVGWGELKFKPGAHAKTALRFDYGRFNETVTAVEVGVNMEYYLSDVKQMTLYQGTGNPFLVRQNNMFFNAYISFLFGTRK